MVNVHKYMFDEDFESPSERYTYGMDEALREPPPVEVPVIPPEPPRPTFSEEELGVARDEAFAAGREAGIAEAAESLERRLADVLEALAAGLHGLAVEQAQIHAELAHDAVELAVLVTRKIMPAVVRHHGADEVVALVDSLIPHLLDQPRVVVRTEPELVEALRPVLVEVADANGFEGRLVVVGEHGIGFGDCRVEWGDGGAERKSERVWQEIGAIIDSALGEGSHGGADDDEHDSRDDGS